MNDKKIMALVCVIIVASMFLIVRANLEETEKRFEVRLSSHKMRVSTQILAQLELFRRLDREVNEIKQKRWYGR